MRRTFCMRALRDGNVARSTWIDSSSKERQVWARAASSALSSKGSVLSIELQNMSKADQPFEPGGQRQSCAFARSQCYPMNSQKSEESNQPL